MFGGESVIQGHSEAGGFSRLPNFLKEPVTTRNLRHPEPHSERSFRRTSHLLRKRKDHICAFLIEKISGKEGPPFPGRCGEKLSLKQELEHSRVGMEVLCRTGLIDEVGVGVFERYLQVLTLQKIVKATTGPFDLLVEYA